MATNIYVGNLTFNTNSADLENLFAAHGTVSKAQVVTDRDTGRSAGSASLRWTQRTPPRRRSML